MFVRQNFSARNTIFFDPGGRRYFLSPAEAILDSRTIVDTPYFIGYTIPA
jgi:hypothetical protein